MKPLHLVLVLVGIAIVGAGLWYLVLRAPVAPTEDVQAPSDTTFTGSLSELAARGGTSQCTFSSDANGIATNGTVYVSGANIRGDFTTAVPSFGTVESHMIADGTTVHTWSSMMNTGFSMPQTQAQATENIEMQGQSMDLQQSYSYSCVPWIPDASKFELPSEITFTTL